MKLPSLKRHWVGLKVKSLRALKNGMHNIPAGTVFTVLENHRGLKLESEPCPLCGVSSYITRVEERAVEIIE